MDQLTALLESVMLLGQLAQDIALVKGDIRQVAPSTSSLHTVKCTLVAITEQVSRA